MGQSSTITPRTGGESNQAAHTEPPGGGKSFSRLVPLAMTFEELLGGDDVPDETADEMIQAVRQWRDTPPGVRLG